jgi:hypothetical protein
MIKRLINIVRNQPNEAKDKIALGVAGGFTAIVFVIWAYHLPARMESMNASEKDSSSPAFSQLISEVKEVFSSDEARGDEVDLMEALNIIASSSAESDNLANVNNANTTGTLEIKPPTEVEESESVETEEKPKIPSLPERDRSPMPGSFGFTEEATSSDSVAENSDPNSLPDSPAPSENETAPEESNEPLEPGVVLIEAVSDEESETAP